MSSASERVSSSVDVAVEHWRPALVAVLVATAFVGTIGVIAVSPSTHVPVGIQTNYGDSMQPAMNPGSLIIFVDVNDVETGDVVAFNTPKNGWIIHRAVEKTEHGFVTKGDNEQLRDQISYPFAQPETNIAGEAVLWIDGDGIHVRLP